MGLGRTTKKMCNYLSLVVPELAHLIPGQCGTRYLHYLTGIPSFVGFSLLFYVEHRLGPIVELGPTSGE